MASHTESSSDQPSNLILMKVVLLADQTFHHHIYFSSEGFLVRVPEEEWVNMGRPKDIHFGLSTLGLSVSAKDHNVRLYDDTRRLVRFMPISPEGLERIMEISKQRWTESVQLRLIDGELVMREMKQIAGIEDSGYEAWSPMDGLSG